MTRLPAAFFNRPTATVAQELLGKELSHTTLSGLIVETEAYLHSNDAAAHGARGQTTATRALRMGPGTLYIHAMRAYVGLDIVTADGSVLIRALQPLHGLPNLTTLCNGPGKLCRALSITRALYARNIASPTCPLSLHHHTVITPQFIHASTRIGITKNTEPLLRFTIKNSPYLSRT